MAAAPQMLIPMARVRDVEVSIAYYAKLGFHVRSTNIPPGAAKPTWAMLEGQSARLMVTSMGEPPHPEQAVLFYLYYEDVTAAHQAAANRGLNPGELCFPFYCPRGEFRLTDPDGYVLMVAHT